MSVYAKLAQAQAIVDSPSNDGFNPQQNYRYASNAEIMACAKAALSKVGLCVIPVPKEPIVQRVETKTNNGLRMVTSVQITIVYQVIDPDVEPGQPGHIVEIPWHGYAEDYQDKAFWKAYTGTNKYFYRSLLGMSTDDDPERDGKPVKQAQPQQQQQRQNVNSSDVQNARAIKTMILNHIKDKPEHQIKALFGIESDLSISDVLEQIAEAGDIKLLRQLRDRVKV